MGFQGFDKSFFAFFRDLAKNNDRAWFEENKPRYKEVVVAPCVAFIEAIGPKLKKISPPMPQPMRKIAVTSFPFTWTTPTSAPSGIKAVTAGTRAKVKSRWSKQSKHQHADATRKTNQ